ncbi:SCO2524 family protein [Dactylosporangium matsuzakiense]|nr:SCO2524 family protein [Dactylosporangium matsuzakiense]UWZ45873.1 hypothetical protein Dmats_05150 [Dactylosporangium matsuzakiense]
MRMQPRQELLDIWRATIRYSWRREQWHWGGRHGRNCISDAEQLLCILLPTFKVQAFAIDNPDRTGQEMIEALKALGGASEIPRKMIGVLLEYYRTYIDEAGTPTFAGGSYFATEQDDDPEPTEEQRGLDIVDAYAMAVTLSLATIGFAKFFRLTTRRPAVWEQIDELSRLASSRLTAAMVGLLRSFSVNVFDADSEYGVQLIRMVNQGQQPTREVVAGLRRSLTQTTASFREVLIGSGGMTDIDSPSQLFECGWSWSIVEKAPLVVLDDSEQIGEQRAGVAEDAPYLYFTVIALHAIEDLFSERTRAMGLLNQEQERLARALQLRFDLTRSYWATVATYGQAGRWPIEDVPWRTTDGQESDYFTLQVTSLAVMGLLQNRSNEAQLQRIGNVLIELANRGRMIRRPYSDDTALQLHHPGVRLELVGSENAGDAADPPRLSWYVPEFTPLLLYRIVAVAGLLIDIRERYAYLALADEVWEHLGLRRLQTGAGRNLWDDPGGAFPQLKRESFGEPSWLITERVVAALVQTATVLDRPPLHSDILSAHAVELLNEAEQLFDRELLRGNVRPLAMETKNVRASLRRAREVVRERPGTAAVLAANVLNILNDLAAGRSDSEGI